MSTIIYTKPACVQCTATKREFDKLIWALGFVLGTCV